jgi:hypothetical protein
VLNILLSITPFSVVDTNEEDRGYPRLGAIFVLCQSSQSQSIYMYLSLRRYLMKQSGTSFEKDTAVGT